MLLGVSIFKRSLASLVLITLMAAGLDALADACEAGFLRTPPFEILPEDQIIIVRIASRVWASGRELKGDFRFIRHGGKIFDLDGILPERVLLPTSSMLNVVEMLEPVPALRSRIMAKAGVWVASYDSYVQNPSDLHGFESMSGRIYLRKAYLEDKEWRSFPFMLPGPNSIMVREGDQAKRIDKRLRQMAEQYQHRTVPYPFARANAQELKDMLSTLEQRAIQNLATLVNSRSINPNRSGEFERDSAFVVEEVIRTTREDAIDLGEKLDRYPTSYIFDLRIASNQKDFYLIRKIKDLVRTRIQEARVALRVNGLKGMSLRGDEAVARGFFPEEFLREDEGLRNHELDVIGEDGIFEVKSAVFSDFRAKISQVELTKIEERKQDLEQRRVLGSANLHNGGSLRRFKVYTDGRFLNDEEEIPPNTYGLIDPDGRILMPK